jgi:hypothetical protein
MARGRKTGGKNFAKGHVANPKGGGALSPEIRAVRKITLEHIEEVADIILDGNIEKLKQLAANPETSVLKMWLAKAAAEGIRKGDLSSLETILSRVMGRPRNSVDVAMDPEKNKIEIIVKRWGE